MKLAIMQPYFVPYLGYWQLLNTVDRFVIYDDVNFIKGGWINRNRILINGKPSYITLPLCQASPNKLICDISLQASPVWRSKIIKSIENTYQKALFFSEVFPIIEQIISYKTDSLVDFLAHHLRTLSTFLRINTEFIITSRCYHNNHLNGQDRILDICRHEGATTYINPQGGHELYDTGTFRMLGVDLRFIVMQPVQYRQRADEFIARLSLIDILMEIGPHGVAKQLDKFHLLTGESLHA